MQTLNRLIVLYVVIVVSGALIGCTAKIHSKPGTTTTVVLTRHAERTTITKVLTDKGHARAKELVQAVGDMDIAAIYSPDMVRNLDTVRPLAIHLGIDITVVSSKPDVDEIIKTILSRHAGEVVLWVGNTTNLSDFYYKLGGEGKAPDDYGDLFILRINDEGFPDIIKKRYGAL